MPMISFILFFLAFAKSAPNHQDQGYLRIHNKKAAHLCGLYRSECSTSNYFAESINIQFYGDGKSIPKALTVNPRLHNGMDCDSSNVALELRMDWTSIEVPDPSNSDDAIGFVESVQVKVDPQVIGLRCTETILPDRWYSIVDTHCFDNSGFDKFAQFKELVHQKLSLSLEFIGNQQIEYQDDMFNLHLHQVNSMSCSVLYAVSSPWLMPLACGVMVLCLLLGVALFVYRSAVKSRENRNNNNSSNNSNEMSERKLLLVSLTPIPDMV